MLKDRGTKKWTSLMLPEHITYLKEMWNHELKVQKPVLDEQQLELMDDLVSQALEEKQKVKLTIYVNGDFKSLTGIILTYEMNFLHVQIDHTKTKMIHLENIISLQMA